MMTRSPKGPLKASQIPFVPNRLCVWAVACLWMLLATLSPARLSAQSLETPKVEMAFNMFDWISREWEMHVFALAQEHEHCKVWVRREDLENMSPSSLDQLQNLGRYFDEVSYPHVSRHMPPLTHFFEAPDKKINLVFTTECMQYNANGASYGGYFMKEDYRETEHSNRGHFLYVNFKTATNPDDSTIRYCRSILSHEFQHLLNANYFAFNPQFMNTARRAMDSWANELCSVTLECLLSRTGEASLHTHQLDFYIQQYKTLPGFINGSSEFLFKPMSREAYATRALFGCYLYSQIPTNRRDDFFKTLLNLTGEKDIHGKRHSSVEDLLLTLEACEYPAAGWKKMKPLPIYTSAFIQATQNNWHLVMRGFLTALCGKNPAFNAFLHEHSDCETMTPTCVTDGGQFPLHASGFLIAPTRIANLQSPYVSSATASNTILYKGCKYKTYPAYAVIFNGSLPSPTALNAATQQTLPNLLTLKSDALVQPPLEMLASKAKSAFDFPHHFDQGIEDIHEAMRFLEERAPIPGLGYPVNGQNEDGSCNTCFYIQR